LYRRYESHLLLLPIAGLIILYVAKRAVELTERLIIIIPLNVFLRGAVRLLGKYASELCLCLIPRRTDAEEISIPRYCFCEMCVATLAPIPKRLLQVGNEILASRLDSLLRTLSRRGRRGLDGSLRPAELIIGPGDVVVCIRLVGTSVERPIPRVDGSLVFAELVLRLTKPELRFVILG
jgi:hypothetical protein